MHTEIGKYGEEEKWREGREEKGRKDGGQEESVHRESIWHLGSISLTSKKMNEIIPFPQWDAPFHSYH